MTKLSIPHLGRWGRGVGWDGGGGWQEGRWQ